MQRIVVLGRGAAGKTTTALRLARLTGLPVLELDRYFWSPDLTPTPPDTWTNKQRELAATDRWIMDGDLGPYDNPAARLDRADTVLVLDFGLLRCSWRAFRRSRERLDFWWWLLSWRYRSRPTILRAVATYAPNATVHTIRSPHALRRLLTTVAAQHSPPN